MPAVAGVSLAFAAAAEITPEAAVGRFYDELLAVMKEAKRLSFEARYRQQR